MSKHSPGPWRLDVDEPYIYSATGETVISGQEWSINNPADARLIAAAPELLEALKALLNQVHADCLREGESAAVELADALIRRMEGEE